MANESDVPQGILSLTYHLVNDNYYTQMWLNKQYDDVFKAFGISSDVSAKLLAVNAKIGGAMTKAQAEELVNAWLDALRGELTPATETLW